VLLLLCLLCLLLLCLLLLLHLLLHHATGSNVGLQQLCQGPASHSCRCLLLCRLVKATWVVGLCGWGLHDVETLATLVHTAALSHTHLAIPGHSCRHLMHLVVAKGLCALLDTRGPLCHAHASTAPEVSLE
jgi:hypothetical protein